jgi:hypothetical protein
MNFEATMSRPSLRQGGPVSKNGELLRRAAQEFDLLLTVDRNLEYQQNFSGLAIAVVVIHASSNDIAVLRPLMRAVLDTIPKAKAGVVTHVHVQPGS